MKENSAPDIIEAIGEEFFTETLGFKYRNLRHVKKSGKFAAQWYKLIASKCLEQGVACPMSAFNMKQLDEAETQSGSA